MAEALVDVVARAMKKTAADLDEYLEPEHLAAAALAAIDAAGYAVVPKELSEALGKLGALLVVEAKAKASVLAWMRPYVSTAPSAGRQPISGEGTVS